MNYLSVQNLTKYYGEKILFDNLTYNIDKGQRVAFIAKNGSGKSTMLKILQNQEPQESGVFSFHKDVQVGFLTQEPSFDGKLNVYETILRQKNPKLEAALAYEEALEGIGDLNKAMEAIDSLNAWDYEAEVKHILTKLQIFDLHQKVETLSGGQKRRLALAALLIHQPDLMILDEPTNHLDIEMIEWLEEYLSQSHITLLLITHDRYFLESVCNEILELEDGVLYRHRGNYSNYIENKLLREENQRSNQLKAQNIFRRELEWMRKQPKARTTKSKSRIDAFEDVSNRAKKRTQEEKVQLEIKMERLGGKILEFHNVSKSISNKLLFEKFNYKFKKGERIGIVGKNGCGKSTFLNILIGIEKPDAGNIVHGETVVFGYYNQKGLQLKEDKRVLEVVKDIAEVFPTKQGNISASQMLERFLFVPAQQHQYVSTLSGGEKKRLFLLTILMKNPNFLILDEPTNDLDLMTLGVLEDFLDNYPGCLLIVSHDRYFLNRLTDHLFIFEGNGNIRDFNGNYLEYKEQEALEKKDKTNSSTTQQINETSEKTKKKLSFKEEQELLKIEKLISDLNEEKKLIEVALIEGNLNHDKIAVSSKRLHEINTSLEAHEWRWLELSEI